MRDKVSRMQVEEKKEIKNTKVLLKESMLNSLLNIHKLHLNKPFGSGLSELDFLQCQILQFIAKSPTTIKDIAKNYTISRRIAESNVSYLLKLDLIDKKTKKAGGRGSLISITDYGNEILETVNKQIDSIFTFTSDKYSIKQERTLIAFLDEFCAVLNDL